MFFECLCILGSNIKFTENNYQLYKRFDKQKMKLYNNNSMIFS